MTEIEAMDRAALIAAWSEFFGSPAPRGLSRRFLRCFLATELQTRRFGGLSKQVQAAISRPEDRRKAAPSPTLKAGGRLLREWNGKTHVVDVLGGGFAWNGQHYRSLSAIAREITGANWSGPRFFGLNRKASK
ncbi:DUF2924 domain-containing protein [Aestuariicoccus sp. MJ-SS9]|uniref:DUF2924 domain-containing protein n=1 Tax=Aestuariicoccus sp. MJ-SS9 TaxID=3079855 RepID=UPI00290DD1E9|nr:DUF2924 domain-containing protein [Aestuariicoccus sp. MJ-SS9]MDU8912503.1 DUF2924 domain-containing protein [Aestuariicoccus sp. MJ-SS9]